MFLHKYKIEDHKICGKKFGFQKHSYLCPVTDEELRCKNGKTIIHSVCVSTLLGRERF